MSNVAHVMSILERRVGCGHKERIFHNSINSNKLEDKF